MAATTDIKHAFPGAILHPTPYFGYPTVSAVRRFDATILGVIHTTETTSVPYPQYVVKDGVVTVGKSWTFSVERDGTVHQFMDPVYAAPWTNGDAQSWDTDNPLVVKAAKSGYNFNEFCFVTIENVNRIADGQRLTEKQLEANRAIMQWASKLSGLPLDRRHVIGHYQINGVSRVNCPTVPSDRDRVFGGIVGSPEETMDTENIKAISPLIVTLARNANIRMEPDLHNASVDFNVGDKDVAVVAIGRVWGPEFPDGSGDHIWYAYLLNDGGLRFFHRSQVAHRRAMLDPMQVQPDAQVTELQQTVASQSEVIAGLKTELGEAKAQVTAAQAEVEEAKALVGPAQALKDALQTFMG